MSNITVLLDSITRRVEMTGEPTLSAVVLNYRDADLTLHCLSELCSAADHSGTGLEVILVDNSAPLTASILRRTLSPSVRLIENEINRGYAAGCNQGIQLATGQYVLLLNNDVFITPKCIELGVSVLKQHQDVGIWAPRLCDNDGHALVSCAPAPSLLGLVGEYWFGRSLTAYRDCIVWKIPREVDTVVGAYQLIPRSVIDIVGPLDEDFFFTVEDMDYCYRVRAAGYRVVFDPRCTVTHLGSASQDHSHWDMDPYLHHSRGLYFEKHFSSRTAWLAKVIIDFGLRWRRTLRSHLFTDMSHE